jgi:hypothetical protein
MVVDRLKPLELNVMLEYTTRKVTIQTNIKRLVEMDE